MTNKLERLEEQRAKINAKIQAVKNREAKKKRAEDTRRKILIGSYILVQIEKGTIVKTDIINGLNDYLDKKNDRKLFGLD